MHKYFAKLIGTVFCQFLVIYQITYQIEFSLYEKIESNLLDYILSHCLSFRIIDIRE